MKERRIFTTEDGSKSIFIPDMNEQYHSRYGAVQEAELVYIQNGLAQCKLKSIRLLELGFGTGLNAMLSHDFAVKNSVFISYLSLEKYPLLPMEWEQLQDSYQNEALFRTLHVVPWNTINRINSYFELLKIESDFNSIIDLDYKFDVIFYDAFAPDIQPWLWTKEIFMQLFEKTNPGGILTTYTAKGQVRRTLQEVGFKVERIAGPKGKREMLRAIKL